MDSMLLWKRIDRPMCTDMKNFKYKLLSQGKQIAEE